ncbi:MAG TPA: MBL fold metallo-hydrolase [Gammaproteobacteria bacterium]|nr:MBL fold metallo-hydrolase [Gammaproteobacteria bacterium]
MRFALLGSGSKGNATVVTHAADCILIDCGFSCQETVHRLDRLGLVPEQINAILVTHEHGDHVRGVSVLSRKYDIPVWMTAGTRAACKFEPSVRVTEFNPHQSFTLGCLHVQPVPVPHDAREPTQFVITEGQQRLGILTDTGSTTPHILDALHGVDALILEWNHDQHMLAESSYPESLKRRVGSDYGHLANHQSLALLQSLDTGQLRFLIAAHISEKNNSTELINQLLNEFDAPLDCQLLMADQQAGLDWCQL